MNGKTKKIIQWTAGVIFSLLIIFNSLVEKGSYAYKVSVEFLKCSTHNAPI